jgi:hypothetical protein
MSYVVLWSTDAENDLARLWVEATDRNEITRTAETIDSLLRHDAHLQGESREGISRVLICLPLVAEFDVVEAAQIALVVGVWKVGRR